FTGQPIERIEADSDRDRWFTAAEALEYGFVDHNSRSQVSLGDAAPPSTRGSTSRNRRTPRAPA
ncbi:hypothetical protein GR254_09575, partial [Mycobacterium tuberculosis]|nr:hypothetical protein [Mycobacterium tuberculosis]